MPNSASIKRWLQDSESHNMTEVSHTNAQSKCNTITSPEPYSEPYLTLETLASRLHVSHATIYRLLRTGLPSLKLGKQRRFEISKVVAWLEQQD